MILIQLTNLLILLSEYYESKSWNKTIKLKKKQLKKILYYKFHLNSMLDTMDFCPEICDKNKTVRISGGSIAEEYLNQSYKT